MNRQYWDTTLPVDRRTTVLLTKGAVPTLTRENNPRSVLLHTLLDMEKQKDRIDLEERHFMVVAAGAKEPQGYTYVGTAVPKNRNSTVWLVFEDAKNTGVNAVPTIPI